MNALGFVGKLCPTACARKILDCATQLNPRERASEQWQEMDAFALKVRFQELVIKAIEKQHHRFAS